LFQLSLSNKYSARAFYLRDVATSKLASDRRSGSEETEHAAAVQTSEIYSWASQLASESRKSGWVSSWYVWPSAVQEMLHKLETTSGGIFGLVGFQGVGKSSALQAIFRNRVEQADRQRREKGENGSVPLSRCRIVLFKWRREPELSKSLLSGSHEASEGFLSEYLPELLERSSTLTRHVTPTRSRLLQELSVLEHETESVTSLLAAMKDPGFYASAAALDEVNRLERKLDKAALKKMREIAWFRMLGQNDTILIDTPDYSKTDRRLMAKDLEGVYWLWNAFASSASSSVSPNIVLAIQKEMFRDHFFFDKMVKVELEPLRPEQMVEAYRKRFKSTDPFTEDALVTLARMSRGIFRRYLRYIALTLRHWETNKTERIDTTIVKEAVTFERLARDMELELVELFPKQSDLRLQAVRLLMHLEECGPRRQTELAGGLGMEGFAVSRLLTKLELHRYVVRRREGADKIVSVS